MLTAYTLGGIVGGLVLAAAYVGLSLSRSRRAELADAAELLLAALAAAGGAKLLVIAFAAHELKPLAEEDRGYMVLGSLGVFWVAAVTAIRVFGRLVQVDEPPPPPVGGDAELPSGDFPVLVGHDVRRPRVPEEELEGSVAEPMRTR